MASLDYKKRFFLFTGKGGVGKTSCSLAFAKFLKDSGKKVKYICFEKNVEDHIFTDLKIDHQEMELLPSTKGYITKKLGSEMIASWIIKTPFFKSLLNMLPGFSYVIYLGHILEMLHNDPELIIILDSPSSGHTLTMLEACFNFKEIFQTGILVEDINKMLHFVYDLNLLKINICAFPTTMAINEAIELQEKVRSLEIEDCDLYLNNSIASIPGLKGNEALPTILRKKIDLEDEVMMNFGDKIKSSITHISSNDYSQIIAKVSEQSESFL